MSDDPKPADDLRDGLGLLFRAAKNLAKDITPDRTEKMISDTGGELLRVVTVVGTAVGTQLGKAADVAQAAVERAVEKAERASEPPPAAPPPGEDAATKDEARDDAPPAAK